MKGNEKVIHKFCTMVKWFNDLPIAFELSKVLCPHSCNNMPAQLAKTFLVKIERFGVLGK